MSTPGSAGKGSTLQIDGQRLVVPAQPEGHVDLLKVPRHRLPCDVRPQVALGDGNCVHSHAGCLELAACCCPLPLQPVFHTRSACREHHNGVKSLLQWPAARWCRLQTASLS